MDKLVETMTRISGASSRIRDIITVIDDDGEGNMMRKQQDRMFKEMLTA